MRIIDGIKLRGQPAVIPDCTRDDLPQFFADMGYKVGVELGVYKGEFTQRFCKVGLKMYAIDPWKAYAEYNEPERNNQARQDFVYGHTQRLLVPYKDLAVIIRKTSMEAVKDFEDESLDFVYIDAHHGFKFVTEDIYEWSKKVRKGGIVSGHDYFIDSFIHVKYVLDGYTKAYGINNWYVLGQETSHKRKKYRSWFWVKE